MTEPTLENVLACKYSIKENLLAEGTFVAILGVDREAVGLVSLGISDRCLVTARLLLGGDDVDYDVLALTSLSLLSISVHNEEQKKIKINSQFKPPQLFQLCSSEDQDDIWKRFVDGILRTNANRQGDTWFPASLTSVGSDTHLSSSSPSELGHTSSLLSEFYPWTSNSRLPRAASSFTDARSDTKPRTSGSTSSLPEPLYSAKDEFLLSKGQAMTQRRHSVDVGDIRFESFVNDAPTRFSEYNRIYVKCSWNGSADDMVRSGSGDFNTSNNVTNKASVIEQDKDGKSSTGSNRFCKALNSLFCRNKKKDGL